MNCSSTNRKDPARGPEAQKNYYIYWSTHLQRESNETETSSYGQDWQRKGLQYGLLNLDVTLTQRRRKSSKEVKIQSGIFQGDALSTLPFVIAMMPINHLFSKCTARYKLSKSQENINNLVYMDNIKVFTKNETELETLKLTVRM